MVGRLQLKHTVMPRRDLLLGKLAEYTAYDEKEELSRKEMIDFVAGNCQCFESDYEPGHVTGSALVVDRHLTQVLLNHHRGLGKWLQFGGHCDGKPNPFETAWREAEEESGLTSLEYVRGHEGIFDLDIHRIPLKADRPAHLHYDVRILLTADASEPMVISSESHALKWVSLAQVPDYNDEPGILRMVAKVRSLGLV